MSGVISEERRCGLVKFCKSASEYILRVARVSWSKVWNEGPERTDGVVVRTPGQWFTRDIVDTVHLGLVIGHVIYTT
jgi:hypothetical protein